MGKQAGSDCAAWNAASPGPADQARGRIVGPDAILYYHSQYKSELSLEL
jgi:hypothetical protein